jgi:hypothetical protein
VGAINIPSRVSTFAQAYIKNRCKINGESGCWEWQKSGDKRGYGLIKHKYFGGDWMYVHRAMWYAHGNTIPEGMILLHACDNPKCCNPAHLSLGTHKENTADMLSKGRQSSKLSNEDVKAIKVALNAYPPPVNITVPPGTSFNDMMKISSTKLIKLLADQYDVSPQTIKLIQQGKTWTHII